jgi:surface polysaccharide O-acyltransferase-like enzyme
MSVTDIDVWIGKTLFVPPIIKFCQITKQSQYAVSRLFWFITALDQLRIASSLTSQIIAGLFSLFMMFTASLRADMPAFSMRWFRMMALALLILDVLSSLRTGQWKGVEIWVLVLIAEYAATITNVPPAESKKRAADLKAREANR